MLICVLADGLSGISKMTRAKVGQKICVSSPSLTQWKISGRECFSLVIYWSHIIIPFLSYNKAWKFEWQIMMDLTWHHFLWLLRLYNHIQQPSKLGFGCDYSLFKVRSGSVCIWPNGNLWLIINKPFYCKAGAFLNFCEHHSDHVTADLIICKLIKR